MSQQVINILVAAGGILVAAGIIAMVRSVFKMIGAIRDNTAAITRLSATNIEYMHTSDSRAGIMQSDIQALKDWRLRTESTNRAVALGQNGAT